MSASPSRTFQRLVPFIILAAFVAVAATVVLWFPHRQRRSALEALRHKAETSASLLAYAVGPAVDFGDTTAVLDALGGVAHDVDFVGVAVEGSGGVEIARLGDPSAASNRTLARAPIALTSGSPATLWLAMSTTRIETDSASRRLEATWVAALVVALGLLVALFVARSFERIAELVEETEHARRAAEESNQVKSRFLANMSHEMRTPLNGVLGIAELLGRRLEGEPATLVRTLSRSARTLLALVNDLLDLSRIEAGKLELELGPVDVEAIALGVAETFQPVCHDNGLELVLDVAPDVPARLEADALRFEQILSNLVGNAVKFTPTGSVTMALSVERDRLVVDVRDSGIGIPAEKLGRVFEAFTQADTSTTRRYGGSGLGLAISRQLARRLGGELTVESQVGVGTTFTFDLPLVGVVPYVAPEPRAMPAIVVGRREVTCAHLAAYAMRLGLDARLVAAGDLADWLALTPDLVLWDASEPEPTGAVRAALEEAVRRWGTRLVLHAAPLEASALRSLASAVLAPCASRDAFARAIFAERGPTTVRPAQARALGRDVRVLLAEDDETNQLVASHLLAELGARVETVPNGRAAVERLAADPTFDLVLMDCQMPELDGYAATRAIREAERRSGRAAMPIVAVTAHALAHERARAIEAGMDGYLTKPLSLDALRAIIVRHAPGCAPPRSTGTHRALEPTPMVDDPSFLAVLRPVFESASREALVDLGTAIERGDVGSVRRHAHKLKGSCLTLGARIAAERADTLETLARSGSLDGALELLVLLEVAIEDVNAELERTSDVPHAEPRREEVDGLRSLLVRTPDPLRTSRLA